MKISTRGRYAIRIMLDLALNGDDKPVSFRDISERQGISFKYMEQIGSLLTHAGFIKGVRGAQGGYNLLRKPSEYTVGEILRITEGQLIPVPCVAPGADCPNNDHCLTRPLWEKLNKAIEDVIDNMTLQDLLDNGKEKGLIKIACEHMEEEPISD